nr:MAG TPA: hypothetical protein [Caudoviricetes sp.]
MKYFNDFSPYLIVGAYFFYAFLKKKVLKIY